jgi:hypothetical protein
MGSTHFESQAGTSRGGDRWLQGYENKRYAKEAIHVRS